MNLRFEFRRDMYRRKRNVQKDSERAEIRQILNFGFTDSRKYGIMSLVLPCTDNKEPSAQAGLRQTIPYYLYRADAREFDSCIIRKVLAGRIKPVLFLSSFSFYYLVIFSDVWYNYYRGDCYACYYI